MSADQSAKEQLFQKLLKEIAGQLWQSRLEETLADDELNLCIPSECHGGQIHSYEELFDVLAESSLISPKDISLLSNLLEKLDMCHLLWPLYEAGFGRTGLRRNSGFTGTAAVNLSPNASEVNLDRPETVAAPAPPSKRKRLSLFRPKHKSAFKELLRNVGSEIGSEDLGALLFLCQDVIPRCQLEQISTGLGLFTALRKRRCITAKKPEFLYRILHDCGRLDLSHIVDGYVYLCMKQKEQEKRCESSSDEEEVFYEGGRNYKFRISLKQLADKLGHTDLQSMKIVSGMCIPESKLERVKTVFELFILLEERGKLSPDDLSFLEELLEEKVHLVHQLYEKGFGQKSRKYMSNVSSTGDFQRMLPMHMMFSPERLAMSFKRLLKAIGFRLTSHDIEQLKYLCSEDISVGGQVDIESGLDLLVILEKRQVISPLNVDFLEENLESIGRKDLCTILNIYKHCTQAPRWNKAPDFQMNKVAWTLGAGDAIPDFAGSLADDRNPDGRSSGTPHHCSVSSLAYLHTEYSDQSPMLQKQLKMAELSLESERHQHKKEIAEISAKLEDYSSLLKLNLELQEKNAKTLLHTEQMTQQFSTQETRVASLQAQLEAKDATIQRLSDKLTEYQILERTYQEKECQHAEKLREKEQENKRLLQRIANQEAINKQLISLLGLQVYCLKNESHSTPL